MAILQEHAVKFSSYDILSDEEVRQGKYDLCMFIIKYNHHVLNLDTGSLHDCYACMFYILNCFKA